jgi:DNA-binding NarL/FixJ family response regulator
VAAVGYPELVIDGCLRLVDDHRVSCRVFITDDVEAVRVLWREFLEEHPGIEVVGEAADGNEAVAGVQATRPDVLLLDLSMPERDGLEVIPVVRTAAPATAIVVASGFSARRAAQAAFDLGAVAYFEKGGPAEDLVRVVLAACEASRRLERFERA